MTVGGEKVLVVGDLAKEFRRPGGSGGDGSRVVVHALRGVSFELAQGETLGLVGESGCGKSTVCRCVLRLVEPTAGSVSFMGCDVLAASRSELRLVRQRMQMVFQDSSSALDPRMTVSDIVAEPLVIHGSTRREARAGVGELLAQVGLSDGLGRRYQHQLSAGQRQRVGLARALALSPRALLLDEPVSALDASVRAGVLAVLERVKDERDLSYLFISHDLAAIRLMADRVAIMYLGRIVESGSRDVMFSQPLHPYTQALIDAVPVADPDGPGRGPRRVLHGEHPSAVDPPSGCSFRTRCWKATEICSEVDPPLMPHGEGHLVACHHPEPGPSHGLDLHFRLRKGASPGTAGNSEPSPTRNSRNVTAAGNPPSGAATLAGDVADHPHCVEEVA